MRFSDWMSVVGSSTVATANNMRISSLQANNSGATILITTKDTYPITKLNMVSDLDADKAGRQVEVIVEVAVTVNTVNGTYTTNYGVESLI